MLDQAFSAKNFQRIYDRENRRGRNIDRKFFPDVVEASAAVSAASQRLREARRTNSHIPSEELAGIIVPLQRELEFTRKLRDDLIDGRMVEVAATVSSNAFQLNLTPKVGPRGMVLHPLTDDAASYFVGKQLQSNISRLYKLKPGSRRHIVNQIRDALSSKMDLLIVRTDISAFYESIDRRILIEEIDKDQILSQRSKSHIKCILRKYGTHTNNALGIPRGVGISAYLSELYMRSADEKIRQIEGITYYARYVDDIIAIFSLSAMDDRASFLPQIEAAIVGRSLTLNPVKTKVSPSAAGADYNFEYLGYGFKVVNGKCTLFMAHTKTARYRRRLDLVFSAYQKDKCKNEKAAARRLTSQLKFLTGNTRLINSKGLAFIGSYFTHSELDDTAQLHGLDQYLANKLQSITSLSLRAKLSAYSFSTGFRERLFYRYSTVEIARIVRAWSYEA